MNRGTRRWNLFLDDEDRRRFLVMVGRAAAQRRVEVVAFVLMGNHFHMVVYCPEAGLADFMRDLQSEYARVFNHHHDFNGPVFRGRYRSVPITSDEYLRTVIRYVHRNPLELLDDGVALATYEWSSYATFCGIRPAPSWLRPHLASHVIHQSSDELRRFTETPLPTDKIQNRVVARIANAAAPEAAALAPGLSDVRRAVARAAGVGVAEVRSGKRNGLIGIAVLIASESSGYSSAEIAAAYGFRSPGSVRAAASRANKRLLSDHAYHEIMIAANAAAPEAAALSQ